MIAHQEFTFEQEPGENLNDKTPVSTVMDGSGTMKQLGNHAGE